MEIDKVISFIRSQKNGFFLIEVRTDSQLESIENTLKDIFFEKQYEFILDLPSELKEVLSNLEIRNE